MWYEVFDVVSGWVRNDVLGRRVENELIFPWNL